MEALGVPLEEVVAFGDGNNDVEMLRMVGLGVAMCNGTEVAKNSAKRITAYPNTMGGLGREVMTLREEGVF